MKPRYNYSAATNAGGGRINETMLTNDDSIGQYSNVSLVSNQNVLKTAILTRFFNLGIFKGIVHKTDYN